MFYLHFNIFWATQLQDFVLKIQFSLRTAFSDFRDSGQFKENYFKFKKYTISNFLIC